MHTVVQYHLVFASLEVCEQRKEPNHVSSLVHDWNVAISTLELAWQFPFSASTYWVVPLKGSFAIRVVFNLVAMASGLVHLLKIIVSLKSTVSQGVRSTGSSHL